LKCSSFQSFLGFNQSSSKLAGLIAENDKLEFDVSNAEQTMFSLW